MKIFFDACVIDPLSEMGVSKIDPTIAGLRTAMTPDLERELIAKLTSKAKGAAKQLARSMLASAEKVSFFGFSEENDADPGPCLGWNQGVWASSQQIACIENVRQSDRRRPTGIPLRRTDAYLIALAKHHIVLTNNFSEPHCKTAPQGSGGVIWWSDLSKAMLAESFEDALRQFVRRRT